MKKIKNYARTTLCMALSAAMLFMDMGMSASAAEYSLQEPAPMEEVKTEEPETEKTKETKTTESAAASDGNEETPTEELSAETASTETAQTEDMSAEEFESEESESEKEIELEKETESEKETETQEAETAQNLAFSEDDISHGTSNNITWVVDKDGHLTVTGVGDWEPLYDEYNNGKPPWYESKESIKTASIHVKDMESARNMFSGCSNMESVDLSSFDTSRVTDMKYMFSGCRSLPNLDLSGFNTSQAKTMYGMFDRCSSLPSLDLSSFDTSRVTDMIGMFSGCVRLQSLDLSSFDTSQVTKMRNMFGSCRSLQSLDLSSFDTSQVTYMGSMFRECRSLQSLDLSSFDTSQVTEMECMFSGCSGLSSLDLSSFDTSKITKMPDIFKGCSGLISLDLSSFDTSQMTNMGELFSGCSSLQSLDLSSFDTSQVTFMTYMFSGCSSLQSLDLSSFDTSQVRSMGNMFSGCSSLQSLDLSSFDTSQVRSMGGMFFGCSSLQSLDLSSFDTSQMTQMIDMGELFSGCSSLYLIHTPRNVHSNVDLPEDSSDSANTWKDSDGTVYSALPTDKAESILLRRGAFFNVMLPDETYTYNGTPQKPVPIVTAKASGETLTKNTDYTVIYRNNVNAFDADSADSTDKAPTVIVKGRGAYGGAVTKLFSIEKAPAPAAEGQTIKLEDYDAPKAERTVSLSECFAEYGSKTGYELGTVSGGVLSGMPSIDKDGTLTYGTNAGTLGDYATIPVTVSFHNYKDAVLTVKIIFASEKQTVAVSGITIADSVYNKMPVYYTGIAKVMSEDNTDLTNAVNITYTYSGTQADGSDYAATQDAPINAGSYKLTVAVASDNPTYMGSAEYPFTIAKAPLAIIARDIELETGAEVPKQADYPYDVSGLLEDDSLITEPIFICEIDEKGTETAGEYPIVASGADAGMNYGITYKNGKLTVIEAGTTAPQPVEISGITVSDSVYSKNPVSFTGTAKVETKDGTDVTDKVTLTYAYSGTQADGSSYDAPDDAPINAGSYILTVAVASGNAEYAGIMKCPFTIKKAPLTITARNKGLKIGEAVPKKEDYQYDTKGLLKGDSLITEPDFACEVDKKGTATAGEYPITVSGADAGMNYAITYVNGMLTVSEAGETVKYYTVTYDMSGHGTNIKNTGVKAGSLLKQPADPKADGYAFTGWHKDKACTVKWDFARDTVQSDTTLYAGWTKNGNNGNEDEDDDDKDYYQYAKSERKDLKTEANAEITTNIKAKIYDGSAYEPVIKVTATVDGKKTTLTEGTDYSVSYTNNTNTGTDTATVTVYGKRIYKGSLTKTFTIAPKPVKKLKIAAGSLSAGASADVRTLPIHVYDGAKLLEQGIDYELSGCGSITASAAASATVTVTGVGKTTAAMPPRSLPYTKQA